MNRREFLKNSIKLFAYGLIVNLNLPTFSSAKEIRSSPNKPNVESLSSDRISIIWIGHSTFLINYFGTIILTDPVLLNRIGLYILGTTWGPHRLVQPALFIDELPKPDLVLLTHSHFDHMDFASLKELTEKYPNEIDVIAAANTKDVFEELEWKSIKEIDWDESFNYKSIKIKALKSKHFGWRIPWEKDRSKGNIDGRSFNSYILEKNDRKLLLSCDISFADTYKPLIKENIDIMMMPIGAYNPWSHAHCNPEEAYKMASDINAKYFIPMHTRTLPHGKEPYDEPINWLLKTENKTGPKVGLTEIGQTFVM